MDRTASTPEALHLIIEAGFNQRDVDLVVGAYEDDAMLVVPPDGQLARRRADIRAATEQIVALEPEMSLQVVKKVEGNGIAMTHGRWHLAVTSTDGTRQAMSGRGTLISRRRPDGTWGIVLDDPLSPTD